MNRQSRACVARLTALLSLFMLGQTGLALAQAPQPSGKPSVCIYRDRSFSEGAAICPQARLMLMCSSENQRLVWTVVGDPALAERCLPQAGRVSRGRPLRKQQVARTALPVAAEKSPRCFTFNGKRYCE